RDAAGSPSPSWRRWPSRRVATPRAASVAAWPGSQPGGSATTTTASWRRSGVAELPGGLRFRGTLGWLSWLGVHLVFLIGFRNKAVVLVNWAWNYLRWDHGNRVLISDPE